MGERRNAPMWEKKCLDLLKFGCCSEAELLALEKIPPSKIISQKFISDLCQYVHPKYLNDPRFTSSCCILKCVCSYSAVDDVVLCLIKECSEADSTAQFRVIVQLFLILLSRNCKRKEIYIEWCISFAQLHLRKLTTGTSGERDVAFNIFHSFISMLLQTLSPQNNKTKTIFCDSMLFVVGEDITDGNRLLIARTFRSVIPDMIGFITSFHSEYIEVSSNVEGSKNLSLATFLYFVLSEDISFFRVYSYTYIFKYLTPLVPFLLDDPRKCSVTKGLTILELITPFVQGRFNYCDISRGTCVLLEKLNHVMIYNKHKNLRLRALKSFDSILDCFDVKAQYYIFLRYRPSIKHSGTVSFIISKIKAYFDRFRKSLEEHHDYFNGKRFFDIIKEYGFLSDGNNTNIVNDADQILAALNLFWYLATLGMRREIDVEHFIPELLNVYLNPLKNLVSSALRECEAELSQLKSGRKVDSKFDVTVNNSPLSNLSNEEKLTSVYCSRNALELIKDNVNRILAVIAER